MAPVSHFYFEEGKPPLYGALGDEGFAVPAPAVVHHPPVCAFGEDAGFSRSPLVDC